MPRKTPAPARFRPPSRERAAPAPGLDGLLATLAATRSASCTWRRCPSASPPTRNGSPNSRRPSETACRRGSASTSTRLTPLPPRPAERTWSSPRAPAAGSRCYNAPVLDRILGEPDTPALCIFPTRALAQDQLRALREIVARGRLDARISAVTDDGDTPTTSVATSGRSRARTSLSPRPTCYSKRSCLGMASGPSGGCVVGGRTGSPGPRE